MDNVWESQMFASLAELLAAVNERGLSAERFKVVPEPTHSGRGIFHLLYLTGAEPDPLVASVAVVEVVTADLDEAEERVEAVDEAEAIIRNSQHG